MVATDLADVHQIHRCDPELPPGACDGSDEQGPLEFGGVRWRICPFDAIDNPFFTVAQWLADCASMHTLADWPGGYSFGMVHAIQCIFEARALRRAREMRR